MKLSPFEIATIRNYLITNGLETPEVVDDLTDHLSCEIEEKMRRGGAFKEAFSEAIKQFSPEDIREIQESTNYYLTINSKIMLVKGIFITAFLSVFCYTLGSGIHYLAIFLRDIELTTMLQYTLRMLGLMIFCFGFLPLLFKFGYQQFVARLQE
jgi:hypothetical protein